MARGHVVSGSFTATGCDPDEYLSGTIGFLGSGYAVRGTRGGYEVLGETTRARLFVDRSRGEPVIRADVYVEDPGGWARDVARRVANGIRGFSIISSTLLMRASSLGCRNAVISVDYSGARRYLEQLAQGIAEAMGPGVSQRLGRLRIAFVENYPSYLCYVIRKRVGSGIKCVWRPRDSHEEGILQLVSDHFVINYYVKWANLSRTLMIRLVDLDVGFPVGVYEYRPGESVALANRLTDLASAIEELASIIPSITMTGVITRTLSGYGAALLAAAEPAIISTGLMGFLGAGVSPKDVFFSAVTSLVLASTVITSLVKYIISRGSYANAG